MTTAAECRAKVLEKLLQAGQDKRHRRKHLSAAHGWLVLAARIDQSDQSMRLWCGTTRADDDPDMMVL